MIGLILFLVSKILKTILSPVSHTWAFFTLTGEQYNNYLKQLAIAEDCYGNQLLAPMLNKIAIKNGGYPFGNIKETISSVLGKNKRENNLLFIGKAIDWVLNIFDKNHSIESIDDTVNNRLNN